MGPTGPMGPQGPRGPEGPKCEVSFCGRKFIYDEGYGNMSK